MRSRGGDFQRALGPRLSAHIDEIRTGDRIASAAAAPGTGSNVRPVRCAQTSSNDPAGWTIASRTSAASAADAAGSTKARPSRRAESTIASAPRIARSSPVSASSPANSYSCEGGRRNLPGRGQDAERDRQIEAAGFLRQIGRREIDGDPARRKFELRILQRRANAIARFAHLGLRQTDQVHGRKPAGQMHLDGDSRRVDAGQRTAVHDGDCHGNFPRPLATRSRRLSRPAARALAPSAYGRVMRRA